MAFFNKLNRVAKTAAKSAAELANDAFGSGKIAVKIKREELQIEQHYEKIGEYFYKKRSEGMPMPAELEDICVAIDIAFATIKELEELRRLRNEPDEVDVRYKQIIKQKLLLTINLKLEYRTKTIIQDNCYKTN